METTIKTTQLPQAEVNYHHEKPLWKICRSNFEPGEMCGTCGYQQRRFFGDEEDGKRYNAKDFT